MNRSCNARTVAAFRTASYRIITGVTSHITPRLQPAFAFKTSTPIQYQYRMSSHPTNLHGVKNNTMNGANGVSTRGKRAQKRPPAEEPPRKQPKLNNNNNSPESIRSHVPENSMSTSIEQEVEGLPIIPVIHGPADAEWQKTITDVVKNVVSIQFCQTSAFDTEYASASQATGFVVDAERGLIMTNRHVVGPGPFWGHCIFDNHEEVDVYAVYRDPVHDFGFLRFDPKAIKYLKVSALTLRPDLAKVGVEIRVVGNDAGEKLSILSGVISRLDRNAPEYFGYCDFNTNYIQAAASASGGSSGSPVVNLDGYAIALQAGGRSDGAATDYFLPLDRPLRALRCIQNGEPITRGTIQCQWMTKPFDECRRLGLTPEWEDAIRKHFPKETGLLVAETVLPEGPSDNKVEEGDILVKVNGQLLTQFVLLDDILDTSVGGKVSLLLQRGGEDIEVEVEVGDLHKITPDRFVNVCGSEFHDLSYQQARYYAVPVKGVFICEGNAGFRFESQGYGCILLSVDHKKTPDLETFIEVMKGLPDKSRVKVTYKHLSDLHTVHWSIVNIDRHWTKKMRMAIRNDETGLWDFKDLADALPALPPVPEKGSFISMANAPHPAAEDIVHSFVRITCQMPLKLEGFPYNQKFGVGVVIDATKGLVVCSRAIVPFDMCDIRITVADSIIVDAKVVFLHPLQNYTIIQYDPSLVDAPVKSAKLSSTEIQQGASAYFVGFNENFRIVYAKTTVTEITTVTIPANAAAPRYRALNVNAITCDTNLSQQCANGVLIDQDGNVAALWLTYLGDRDQKKDNEYYLGLPTPTLLPVIKKLQAGEVPKLRMLDVELGWPIRMSQARVMGVSEEWISKVALDNPARHQLFLVHKRIVEQKNCTTGTLLEGDIILTLNGKLVTRVSDLDVMYDHEELDAVIVRDSKEMQIKVRTVPANDLETDRVVIFCGAIIHRAHLAVRQQISKLHSEVYVAGRYTGSPSSQYGLDSTSSITHVNGQKTTDLESFIKAVIKIPDNTYFRLKIMSFDDVPLVITMKKCEHYFPTVEMIKDPSEPTGWRRITYENNKAIEGEGTDGFNVLAHDAVDVEEMEG